MRKTAAVMAFCLGATAWSAANAEETLEAHPQFSGTTVSFEVQGGAESYYLTISGPNGFSETVYSTSGVPSLNLRSTLGRELTEADEGRWTWSITGAVSGDVAGKIGQSTAEIAVGADGIDENGRSRAALEAHRPATAVMAGGAFRVSGGTIVPMPDATSEEAQ